MLSGILGLMATLPALGLMWVGREGNLSLLQRRWDSRTGRPMLREEDDDLDEEEDDEELEEEELEEEELEEEEWLEDEDEEDEDEEDQDEE